MGSPAIRFGPGDTPTSAASTTPNHGVAPVVLFEMLTAAGTTYFWSEHKALWPSVITGANAVPYLDWVSAQTSFYLYGSTQTDTMAISIQNISGNTIQRDAALAMSREELVGAFIVCRIWRGDSEVALLTFIGNVVDVEIDESTMDLSIEGFGNWSAITAPSLKIDVTCGLYFGSVACGSVASTPCQQSYGTCSSIERFQGVIVQWDSNVGLALPTQISQPAPLVSINNGRAF